MYAEILNAVVTAAEQNTTLYAPIGYGSLPKNNGISAYLGPGSVDITNLDRGTVNDLYIVINAKHVEQETALQALSDIHKYITRIRSCPAGSEWLIINISTGTTPHYIGVEDNGQYIYGSVLKVRFYLKGVN